MIWAAVIFIALAAAALEYYSINYVPKRILLSFQTDLSLAEPEEPVCLTFTVRNRSRLPVLYLSASIHFEDGLRICETGATEEKSVEKTITGYRYRRKYFLLPGQAVAQKVQFTPERRGVYHVGRCYLECGDYLGFRSSVQGHPVNCRLVCTAKYLSDLPAFDPLGGTEGDYSVRRFIFEDPTLVYGYRDYTGREPMRQISWKATARTGKLTVRQQDHTQEWSATVIADLWADVSADLEHTLELVRTVCEVLEERHIPYALITNSDLGSVPEGLGRPHLHLIQQRIGYSIPIAYHRFDTLLPKLLTGPVKGRNFILITPEHSEGTDAYLEILDRHADSRTIVFYGKEADL